MDRPTQARGELEIPAEFDRVAEAIDREEGHVLAAVKTTSELASRIHEEVSALVTDLGSVLRPESGEKVGPDRLGEVPPSSPVRSDLAESIAHVRDELWRASIRIQDLRGRIDL